MKMKDGYLGVPEDERRNLYLYYSDASELVAENLTMTQLYDEINRYLDGVNFKSYYLRAWNGKDENKPKLIIDFGSHFKFFHWTNHPEGDLVPERAFHGPAYGKEPKPTYETLKATIDTPIDEIMHDMNQVNMDNVSMDKAFKLVWEATKKALREQDYLAGDDNAES